jgi:kanamycin kinase
MGPSGSPPPQVTAAHPGWAADVAWEGALGGRTWRLVSTSGETRFAKVRPAGTHPSLADERDRLVWTRRWLTVPDVIDHGTDDESEWLVTTSLDGVDATIEKQTMDARELVPMLGAALRGWHEALPVDECPFDFRLDAALEHCRGRVSASTTSWGGLRGENAQLTPAQALARLERDRPGAEDLVVCHGDYCFPNVFITDGQVTGFLDLGELGVADRWWDIAIGAWSTTWNVDPVHEPLFYEGYGVDPDADRIAYYRLLYEVAG